MRNSHWSGVISRIIAVAVLSSLGVLGGQAFAARSASYSNTLVVGWNEQGGLSTFDPEGAITNGNVWVYVNIYDQLLRIENNGRSLEPDLATSWKVTNGGKTYTFHLRKNVRYSNGQKLAASDVVFCLNRARLSSSSFGYLYPPVKSISAPNSSTVVIRLKAPWAPLLDDLALYAAAVYPESYFKRYGESHFSNHPIGTGPYELKTWKPGNYLILQKNPHYWNSKAFPTKYIKFMTIPQDQTRLADLESGAIDVDDAVAWSDIPAVKGVHGIKVQVDRSSEILYLTLNDKLAEFKDHNVRLAIDHAIDRKALVKAVLLGHGTPANSYIPKGYPYWDSKLSVPSYSVKLAKKYLAKSHYKHGFHMTMEVGNGLSDYPIISTIVQSELKSIGIKLSLADYEQTTLTPIQQADKFHMMATNWTNDIPDPDELTSFGISATDGDHTFFTWYNDPKLNQLTTAGEHATSTSKRKTIYDEIQSRWASDAPYYALYYEPFLNLVSTKVKGYSHIQNPLGYFELQGLRVAK